MRGGIWTGTKQGTRDDATPVTLQSRPITFPLLTMTLPELRHYTLPTKPIVPKRRITVDADVEEWKSTQGYLDYGLFIRRLNAAVIGHYLPYSSPPNGPSEVSIMSTITNTTESSKQR